LLPSAKCTRPLFQGRTGCGGRPSGWHDIVTCQHLVVTVLPQLTDKNDGDAVREFCEDHLGIKPWFDDKKCRRIGKSSPQKLLISLNSEQSVVDLIAAVDCSVSMT